MARATKPGKGQNVQDVETSPSCLAVVPRFNGKVLFLKDGGGKEPKAPGEAKGQDIDNFGGSWYVVDAAGNKIDPDDAEAPAPATAGY